MVRQSCFGVLSVDVDDEGKQTCSCWGVQGTPGDPMAKLDLARYHEAYRSHRIAGNHEMTAYTCVGHSAYELQRPSSGAGGHAGADSAPLHQPPAPFCRGLEYIQYREAVQRAHAEAAATAAAGMPVPATVAVAGAPTPVLPASYASQLHPRAANPSTGSSASPSSASPSPSSSAGGDAGPSGADPNARLDELWERLSVLQQDPWWFGRAFAARAEVNLLAMRRTARLLYVAATQGGEAAAALQQQDEERDSERDSGLPPVQD